MYVIFTYIYHKNQLFLEMNTCQLEEIIQGLAENSWGLSSSSSSPSANLRWFAHPPGLPNDFVCVKCDPPNISVWPLRASSTVWREHSTARSSANCISCPKRWVVAEPLGPVGSGT